MSDDPLRLVADRDQPEEVVEAMRAARARGPSHEQASRLAAALGLPPPPVGPGAPPPPPGAPPLPLSWTVGLGFAGMATFVALSLSLGRPAEVPPPVDDVGDEVVEEAITGDAADAVAAPAPSPEVVDETPMPDVEPPAPIEPARRPVRRRPRVVEPPVAVEEPAPPSEPDPALLFREEAALIQCAENALSSNPGRALTLANEHASRFAAGQLGQEREVIAIDALLRLDRRDAAEARAARFERAFPGSVHLRRIRRLLGR